MPLYGIDKRKCIQTKQDVTAMDSLSLSLSLSLSFLKAEKEQQEGKRERGRGREEDMIVKMHVVSLSKHSIYTQETQVIMC